MAGEPPSRKFEPPEDRTPGGIYDLPPGWWEFRQDGSWWSIPDSKMRPESRDNGGL